MRLLIRIIATVTALNATIGPADISADPGNEADKIALAAKATESGYTTQEVTAHMILRDKKGRESQRRMLITSAETKDDGDRILIRFDLPRAVSGTTLLTHTHLQGSDDQWLFLPAMKRTKRIASRNKSGPFVGSEFAYEDFTSTEPVKFSFRYLRDEPCPTPVIDNADGKAQCAVIERTPKDKNSGYSMVVLWYDRQAYRLNTAEYFDRAKRHLKTLSVSGYEQRDGKHWRASEMLMSNHINGKSTLMRWQDYRYDRTLDPDLDFSPSVLR